MLKFSAAMMSFLLFATAIQAQPTADRLREIADQFDALADEIRIAPSVSPYEFGGIPNDGESDSNAFAAMLIAARERGAMIVVPGGEWHLDRTWVIPMISGLKIQGAGASFVNAMQAHSLVGVESRLVWIGEPGGTVVQYSGAGMSVDAIAIVGRRDKNTAAGDSAGVGLSIVKDGSGIGTGKIHFGLVSVRYCDVGIRVGGTEETPTANCDNLVFDYLFVSRCNQTCFKVVNDMGMAITLQFAHVMYTPTAFELYRGGAFQILSGGSYSGIEELLVTGDQGSNNGQIKIANFKIDAQSDDLVFVRMPSADPVQLTVENLRWSGNWNKTDIRPRFKMRGHSVLVLRDCVPLRAGAVEAAIDRDRRPMVYVETSKVTQEPLSIIGPGSNCYADFTRNWMDDLAIGRGAVKPAPEVSQVVTKPPQN